MSTGTAVLFNSRWSVKQIRSRQTSEEKFVFFNSPNDKWNNNYGTLQR